MHDYRLSLITIDFIKKVVAFQIDTWKEVLYLRVDNFSLFKFSWDLDDLDPWIDFVVKKNNYGKEDSLLIYMLNWFIFEVQSKKILIDEKFKKTIAVQNYK